MKIRTLLTRRKRRRKTSIGELLVLLSILRVIKTTGVLLPTILNSAFGILFEFFLGAAKGDLDSPTPGLVFTLIMLWVGFSYTFISLLPIAQRRPPLNLQVTVRKYQRPKVKHARNSCIIVLSCCSL